MTEKERKVKDTNDTLELAEQLRLELLEVVERLENIADRLITTTPSEIPHGG